MNDSVLANPDLAVVDAQGVAIESTSASASASARPAEVDRSVAGSAAPIRAARSRRGIVFEFLRYFAASGGALGVDVGLFQLSLRLGLGYPFAALIGFSAGAMVAYVASVKWVFEARSVRHASIEFALFIAVGVVGLLLTEALLWLEIERLGMPAFWSKLGAACVVFVFNFAVRKSMLFRARAR